MARIGRELVDVLIVNRCKGVMSRVPTVFLRVPFEHREIGYPQESEIFGVEPLVAVGVFLCQVAAEISRGAHDPQFR